MNNQGETVQLTYISPEYTQVLDALLTPDGNNTKQRKVTINKAHKFADSIKKSYNEMYASWIAQINDVIF